MTIDEDECDEDEDEEFDSDSDVDSHGAYSSAALAALLAGLRALGPAAHRLATLRLRIDGFFSLSAAHCAALPPSLRRLEIDRPRPGGFEPDVQLRVEDGMNELTALEHLALCADDVYFQAHIAAPATLPPALTSLAMSGYVAEGGPQALPQAVSSGGGGWHVQRCDGRLAIIQHIVDA